MDEVEVRLRALEFLVGRLLSHLPPQEIEATTEAAWSIVQDSDDQDKRATARETIRTLDLALQMASRRD